MKIDLSDVEGSGDFEPIDPGIYSARVVEVTHETSQAGNQYLSWEFEVTEENTRSVHVWHNTSLTEQSRPFLKGVLESVFPTGNFDKEIDTGDVAKSAVGQDARLRIGIEEYDGKERNTVIAVYPAEGVTTGGNSDETTTEKQTVTSSSSSENADDDIPF